MATFRYRAKDSKGRLLQGRVEAADENLAQHTLEAKNLEIIFLEKMKKRQRAFFTERVRARDLVVFFRELSTLSGASVPLTEALHGLARQTRNSALAEILEKIANDVEAGTRLSAALSRFPRIFNTFAVSMVKSGETAGRLAEVLEYLADQTEKEYDLTSKIRGAMLYPAFIVFGMIAVGLVMLIFVVPQLTEVLIESGAPLPWTTRWLIGISGFMQRWWWLLIVAAILGLVFLRLGLRNPGFRTHFDAFKLRVPVLGMLARKIAIARMARSLQILLDGRVDMVRSLEVVEDVVGNAYFAGLIRETRKEVSDGNSITAIFAQSELIPPMLTQMLSVGEDAGQLTEILKRIGAFYTREIDNSVVTLVSIIEPVLMILIGLGVGLIVAAIILPMYQLAGSI